MAKERHRTVFNTGRQYLGTVYGKALIGAGENAGNTEQVLAELEAVIDDVFAKLPRLESALASPRVPWEAKERMLENAFSSGVTSELLRFIKVITRRGRFDCLRAVAKAAREQLNALRGKVHVDVRSASELDQPTADLVASRLRQALGREVDLELSVDPELIGGLVVRVGDTVYDGSVANRLGRLRNELLSKSSQAIRDNISQFAVTE